MLLKVLTIVFGVMITGTRLAGLASPSLARRLLRGLKDRRVFILVMGLVMSILGATLFWSARRAVTLEDLSLGKAIWALALGGLAAIGGLAVLIAPNFAVRKLDWVQARTDATLRILMLIGVLVGLAILYLGIWVY